MLKIKITSLLILISSSLFAQTRIGTEIKGQSQVEKLGHCTSISENGKVLAISVIPNNNPYVRMFTWDGNDWAQMGQDIPAEIGPDLPCGYLSLSVDGNIVVIGAALSDSSGNDAGITRVFEYTSGSWHQIGNSIKGDSAGDQSGHSVSTNADGSVLAIGSPFNDEGANESGHVKIYRRNGNNWTQVGDEIRGKTASNNSGFSVSLSADSMLVAIGALLEEKKPVQYENGYVEVYRWDGSKWSLKGLKFGPNGSNHTRFGFSVSLSDNGQYIAVGEPGYRVRGRNRGMVTTYQFDSGFGVWHQIGQGLSGEVDGEDKGYSVSLSSDGSILAVGNPRATGIGSVRAYKMQSNSWVQIGKEIAGKHGNSGIGRSVSVALNGRIAAISSPYEDSSGNVHVYELYCSNDQILSEPESSTKPVTSSVTFGISSSSYKYQWQTDIGFGFQNLSNAGQYDGVNTDSLTVEYLSSSNDNQKFRCRTESGTGCFDYSKIVTLTVDGKVGTEKPDKLIELYPNPCSTELNLNLKSEFLGANFSVQDMIGRDLIKGRISGLTISINVNKLVPGHYLLNIDNGKGYAKFVVH